MLLQLLHESVYPFQALSDRGNIAVDKMEKSPVEKRHGFTADVIQFLGNGKCFVIERLAAIANGIEIVRGKFNDLPNLLLGVGHTINFFLEIAGYLIECQ